MKQIEDLLWVEKYRPKKLSDMILPDETRAIFDSFIKKGYIDHLLLHGTYGSGKTTVALVLVNELGSKMLELNASDDRGVGMVRDTVKQFVHHSTGEHHRIVFMDEADGMTPEAQDALKRVIERGSKTARFIFTANSLYKIIPAIRSRCLKIEFTPPPKDYVRKYLCSILKVEHVRFSSDSIDTLIENCYPDIRQCVRTMQLNTTKKGDNYFFRYKFLQRSSTTIDIEQLLKLIKKGRSSFIDIRQFIVDEYIDFNTFYTDLLECIEADKRFSSCLLEVVGVICEYANRNIYAPDRLLNLTGCCAELISIVDDDDEEE